MTSNEGTGANSKVYVTLSDANVLEFEVTESITLTNSYARDLTKLVADRDLTVKNIMSKGYITIETVAVKMGSGWELTAMKNGKAACYSTMVCSNQKATKGYKWLHRSNPLRCGLFFMVWRR